MKTEITLIVNGEAVRDVIEPRTSLADLLRDRLRLTGTHLGCEMGSCGACLVLLDGTPVHACLVLAVQAAGQRVDTIEGLNESGDIKDLQQNFHARNALQCGFCTNGMIMTAHALLSESTAPTRPEIREALSGNYCRCTGYEAIVDAISATAKQRATNAGAGK
ncbi:(2Fe-2S)-binding protein [Thalassovita aquimarina]|uniref:(2Fe-2S)-binding protein n=1 Tax=Thalassovita aquimarina TaxID=2785917 RepID=A0ABS5HUL5_9RHOB|nr:(2Fe-2S)-binding protein [Thalassovita aquimarina]MBR9652263.1 (2Fe-2S)-binding protein [Thalassovita aquimarina]